MEVSGRSVWGKMVAKSAEGLEKLSIKSFCLLLWVSFIYFHKPQLISLLFLDLPRTQCCCGEEKRKKKKKVKKKPFDPFIGVIAVFGRVESSSSGCSYTCVGILINLFDCL